VQHTVDPSCRNVHHGRRIAHPSAHHHAHLRAARELHLLWITMKTTPSFDTIDLKDMKTITGGCGGGGGGKMGGGKKKGQAQQPDGAQGG
jgi:hypothetical protein